MTSLVPDSSGNFDPVPERSSLSVERQTLTPVNPPSGVILRIPEEIIAHPHSPSFEEFLEKAHFRREPLEKIEHSAPCLAFSGLAAAADQWFQVLEQQQKRTGAIWEAHCLKGHEVGWTGLINTTAEDWVDDVIEKALSLRKETGKRPILLGHSTGALACISAVIKYAKEHSGDQLCAGLVISSPAFRLQSTLYSAALLGAKVLHAILPRSGVWHSAGASVDAASQAANHSDATISEKLAKGTLEAIGAAHRFVFRKPQEDKPAPGSVSQRSIPSKDEAPTITVLPILTFLELRKIQKLALQGVEAIQVPTLALISRHDHLTNPKASINAFRKIPAEDKSSIVLDGPHSLMRDDFSILSEFKVTPAEAFRTAIETWIGDRQGIFNRRDDLLSGEEQSQLDSGQGDLADLSPQTPPAPLNLGRLRDIFESRRANLN